MLNKLGDFIQDIRPQTQKILNITFGINSLIGLIVVVLITGFYLTPTQSEVCKIIIDTSIIIFIAQELLFFIIDLKKEKSKSNRRTKRRILALLLLSNFFFMDTLLNFFSNVFTEINIIDISLIYLGILQLTIIFSYIFGLFRNTRLSRLKVNPGLITSLSYLIIILIGTGLLCLPKSTPIGQSISFTDAIFTATSAVCVTGLTTISISESFSIVGKTIILLLIQVGGIGVMTLATFVTLMFLGGLSIRMNVMLREMLSEDNLGQITKLLKQVSIFTFLIEIIGAVLMYISLNQMTYNDMWLCFDSKNLSSAIFHSVASFCNAGLSIYPNDMMNPLLHGNVFFFLISMCLIILGGMGFLALSNISGYFLYRKKNRLKKIRRLNATTKLILYVSGTMIIVGGGLIFLVEDFGGSGFMGSLYRLFYSFYIIVSAKTAGFDPININTLTHFSMLIIMIAMWIGGSPGSTGGGIRNTTIGLLILHLINYLRGRNNLHLGHRRIDPSSIQKAQIIFISTALMTLFFIAILVLLEPNYPFIELSFEIISAISTTGLTLGITPHLGIPSKYLLIFTMYVGRIGVLTFLFAFFREQDKLLYEYPDERVNVG